MSRDIHANDNARQRYLVGVDAMQFRAPYSERRIPTTENGLASYYTGFLHRICRQSAYNRSDEIVPLHLTPTLLISTVPMSV